MTNTVKCPAKVILDIGKIGLELTVIDDKTQLQYIDFWPTKIGTLYKLEVDSYSIVCSVELYRRVFLVSWSAYSFRSPIPGLNLDPGCPPPSAV